MTYDRYSTRSSNRVLLALVVVTILVVALWGTNGGLDQAPAPEAELVTITE